MARRRLALGVAGGLVIGFLGVVLLVWKDLSVTADSWNFILGCTLIYASMFGIGHLVFKNWGPAAMLLGLALLCGAVISRNLNFQTK